MFASDRGGGGGGGGGGLRVLFRIRSFGEREESPPSPQQCPQGPYRIKNIHNIFSGGQLSVVPTKTNLSHILAA